MCAQCPNQNKHSRLKRPSCSACRAWGLCTRGGWGGGAGKQPGSSGLRHARRPLIPAATERWPTGPAYTGATEEEEEAAFQEERRRRSQEEEEAAFQEEEEPAFSGGGGADGEGRAPRATPRPRPPCGASCGHPGPESWANYGMDSVTTSSVGPLFSHKQAKCYKNASFRAQVAKLSQGATNVSKPLQALWLLLR